MDLLCGTITPYAALVVTRLTNDMLTSSISARPTWVGFLSLLDMLKLSIGGV
jgi:hypothetical protein